MHWILLVLLLASGADAGNFVVNTTIDNGDTMPGNGECRNVESFCSLRAAIQEANALGGPDTITLGAHSYGIITVSGAGEDAGATGDLDVTSEITITGVDAASTIIEGGGDGTRQDRIFDVHLGGDLTLRRLSVRDGRATSAATALGGGIFNQGVLDLSECVIADNDANAGGGLFNDLGAVTISECTFSGNDAQNLGFTNADGGAIYSQATVNTVEITQSTLSGNSADQTGHAIFISGGTFAIENSTLSGNLGGATALVIQNADVLLTNATIAANAGAGLSAFSFDGTHTLDIENTIVANHGGNDCAIAASAPDLTITNSLSSDSSCGFDLADTDPQLGPLADNGGPTSTHAPLAGSPVIDAGAASPVCPVVDQRGAARPVDGDGDATADCDIGAVEAPEPGALASGGLALALAAWLARRRA